MQQWQQQQFMMTTTILQQQQFYYNCFFSSLIYSSFDFPTPFPFTTRRGTHRFCSLITSDIYLHRSVLLRRLHSSSYSSFPSPSFLFYDDASLWLGQVLLGPCTLFLFYINHRTSCIISLTLTYSILPWIYQGHCSLPRISLSPHRTIELTLLRNLRTSGIRLNARTP